MNAIRAAGFAGAFGSAVARLMLLLAAATGVGTAAQAQVDVPNVISPLRIEPDRNNINLVDGKTTVEVPVLSAPAAPHLRFDRIQNAAPYMTGVIQDNQASSTSTWRSYSAHTGGGTSESFQCFEADCTSIMRTGSKFHFSPGAGGSNNYVEAGSGAVWHYNRVSVATSAPHARRVAYASDVTYPSGEAISYTYDSVTPVGDPSNATYYRPTRISSNLGYFIAISYQGDTFGTTEWGSVLEAVLYASAAPTTPLGRLTYSADGTTITDHGSRPLNDSGGRVYHCSGCTNTLGIDLETGAGSTQLPGEPAQASQIVAQTGTTVVSAVTRDGVQWTYAYDNLRPWNSINAYLFDRVTVSGPNGYHQIYDISQRGSFTQPRNVISAVTDSMNRQTSYLYDDFFRPYQVTYPEGNSVTIAYDDYGNLIWRRTRARLVNGQPDPALPDIIETAHFPTDPPETCSGVLCNRPIWSRDGLGRQTDYAYGAMFNGVSTGQLTEQVDPADNNGVRRRTSTIYDASTGISRRSKVRICYDTGTTCGTTAPIQTEYDYVGTPSPLLPSAERRIDPATGATLTTTYGYDAAGRLLSTDGPLSGSADATYSRYDVYGRKTWEIGAAGPDGVRLATRTTYRDSDDRPTLVEIGTIPNATSDVLTVQRQTATTYDSRRNPVRETVSAGGTTYGLAERSFDDRGLVQCEARRMNPAVFGTSVDPCLPGQPGSGVNDYGPDRITRTVYDAAGQRLQLREGVGTNAEGTEATWAYNANGQVTTVIDGNGNRAGLHYDGRGRQDCWIFPSTVRPPAFNDATPAIAIATAGAVSGDCSAGLNGGDFERYGYDLVGNRTSLRKRDGSVITYQFDNLNRMTAKLVPERTSGSQALTAAQTRDVYYSYDLRNLQLSARFDSQTGEGVTNVYDGFGRMASSSTNMGGTTRTLGYAYDANGNRTRITHPGTGAPFFDYRYDARNRMYGLLENGVTWIAALTFNDAGERAALGRGGTGVVYNYDLVGRLVGLNQAIVPPAAVTWTFDRNPAGQIRSTTRDNNAYAWTRHYGVNRTYTTNGLNQYTAASGTGLTYDANGNLISDSDNSYVYDVENRLVGASPLTSYGHSAALVYDPLGRLWQVTNIATGAVTRFLYDGDALVAEYDASGAVTARYVHGPGADEPWFWYDGALVSDATRRQLDADWQGSIVAITDATGHSLAIDTYDEYGFPGLNNQRRFQYTGQAWLSELGLYYYKARMYAPGLGRFMQTDPIGYADQFNLYTYVGDDPLNRVDATGQFSLTVNSRQDGPRVVDMINPMSRTQYRYDSITGGIYTDWGAPQNLSGSAEYSRNIDAMIQSPEQFVVDIATTITENGISYNVDAAFTGGVTFVGDNFNPVTNIVVSGHYATGVPAEDGGVLIQTPGQILMHEAVRHAAPRATGERPSNRPENQIRDELNLRRRAPDRDHPY